MPPNVRHNQNPLVSEVLAESFAAWEVAGRGWQVFDYETRIEPPFSRFVPPVRVGRPVDDGRVPGLFGRFFTKNQNTNPISNGEEPPANDSNRFQPQRSFPAATASVRIYLPKELKTSPEQIQQFLLNISSSVSFIAFEIIGTNERIIFQISCPAQEKDTAFSQIKSNFPSLDVRETEDALRENLPINKVNQSIAVDFGLGREWFIPIPCGKSFATDPLIPLIACFDELAEGETACMQIIFSRTRGNWEQTARDAIFDRNGKLVFGNLQNYLSGIKEKLSNTLLAARIRFAVQSESRKKSTEIARKNAAFFKQFSSPAGNELIPLLNDELDGQKHFQSFLNRTGYRTGFLITAHELSAIWHLPSDAVQSKKLKRNEIQTKQVPQIAAHGDLVLGENRHLGKTTKVALSELQATQHLYVLGGSGVGKSTFFCNYALEAINSGSGIAVLDPHGDLVNHIIARIPENRLGDVILFSPADEEFPVGMNFLTAHSELEKTLLASDLVSIFRRYCTSFGDVMEALLSSAVIAFLESTKGGNLLDLKRFLTDKNFRTEFLKTVSDEEIRYYWEVEFPSLRSNSLSPILTRLNLFLRSKIVRHIVGQNSNKLDFRQIMDERKILLMPLSMGLIGQEQSAMLGTLILSKIYMAALSRQNVPENERPNFFVLIDEAHNFLTPSLNQILSSSRKYKLGLGLAHQELTQIKNDSVDILGSILSNCYTRILFRLSETDAAKLAKGLSFFTAGQLMRLGVGEAVARVEQSQNDFNLLTFPLEKVSSEGARRKLDYVRESTRRRYATPKTEVENQIKSVRTDFYPVEIKKLPLSVQKNSPALHEPIQTKINDNGSDFQKEKPDVPPKVPKAINGRGGEHHRELQNVIKRMAESNGFSAAIEKKVADGSVDVSLENKNFKIAVEVSVTSSADYEVKNIRKCLNAGYDYAVVVASDQEKMPLIKEKIQTNFTPDVQERIKVSSLTGLLEFLRQLTTPAPKRSRKKKQGDRLNITEASKFLNVSTSTLYRWVREGKVPFFRVGRGYQFDADELALIGRQDLSGKRKAVVDLPPIEIKKRTPKSIKRQNQRYRKLLNLD